MEPFSHANILQIYLFCVKCGAKKRFSERCRKESRLLTYEKLDETALAQSDQYFTCAHFGQARIRWLFDVGSDESEQTARMDAHSATSDMGLHCLQILLLWVSRLKWIQRLIEITKQI